MTGEPEALEPRPPATAAILYAIAVTGLGALPVWLLSAFAPAVQAELGFDDAQLGMALALFFGFSALTGLPVGRLVQHWGWRLGISFAAGVSALCMALVAVLAHNWLLLVLALCLGAVSNNSSQPAGNLAISLSVAPGRQGLAFGLKQAALPISTFMVGLAVPLFGNGRLWREAFLTAAALALAVAVSVIARSAVHGARALRSRTRDAAALRRAERAARRAVRTPAPKALVLLAIGAGFGTAATISLGGFLVVFAVSEGFTATEGAQVLALGSIVGIASRILSGYLADRRGRRHLVTVAYMMASGCLGFLMLAIFGGQLWGLLLGTVLAFGLGWAWNGLFHLSVVRYSPIPAAVATSIVQTAMSLGAAVGPAVFGLVSAWSFTASWYLGAAILAAAATFILLGRRALSSSR